MDEQNQAPTPSTDATEGVDAAQPVFTLEDARALPELIKNGGDEMLDPEPFESHHELAILSFRNPDGRTMRVVRVPGARDQLAKFELRRELAPQAAV